MNKYSKLFLTLEFIKKPLVIGTITPSSKKLAKRVMERIDFSSAETIVEYGPGTGVFTKEIIASIH